MLVVMGPVLSVSVARLYAGACCRACCSPGSTSSYTMVRVWLQPEAGPPLSKEELDVPKGHILKEFFIGLVPPTALIVATLGSIVTGWATPTEGRRDRLRGGAPRDRGARQAHLGRVQGLDLPHRADREHGDDPADGLELPGSVFSALGTPAFIAQTLVSWNIPGDALILSILVLCFILGWPLEWVPIVVIIVPIFQPILETLKVDMVWFSILLAVTLQTCWLSPPVALSAYYLKGIMPKWDLADIYKGMMPFMVLQWIAVLILYFFPKIILVLPNMMFGAK
jgi:TRAP-type mannitol/chloroaromatic compound transport system permease large subunit